MGSIVRIGCVVCVISGVAGLQEVAAEALFGVQLQAFPVSERAEGLLSALKSTTAPLFVKEDPLGAEAAFKVILGPYGSYMDAWAVSQSLPSSFPGKRFIVELEEDSSRSRSAGKGPEKVAPAFASLPRVDKLTQEAPDAASFVMITVAEPVAELTPEVLKKSAASMARPELLAVGFQGKSNGQGIEALERILAQKSQDPVANAARLRLSRRLLARKEFARVQELLEMVSSSGTADEKAKARMIKAYADSSRLGQKAGFEIFSDIASDESLPVALRSHAMRIAAGHAHASQSYTTAVLAFRQIESEAPSAAERSEASLQLCGLQVELVGRGKGKWAEAIRSCEELAARPGISREIKATADLMRFECFSHSGQNDKALAACENYLKQYPDIRREFVSASVWYGVLLVHAGRREEAAEALKSVLELEISSSDKFGSHEPKARAAYWLAFLALQRDDLEDRDHYVNYIKTELPESLEASRLSALMPAQSPSR